MELKKELKFLDVFCIASGAMISSGIFILPGIAFAKTGPSVFLSYLFAGILALTGAFSIAELSSAMPKAGGDYFFITRSLGPLFGTVSGLLSWFALSLKTAFAIIGISEILKVFFGFNVILSSIILCILFIVINIIGVQEAGKFEIVIVLLLLGIMFFYLIIGFPKVEVLKFDNFAPKGFNTILTTAGFVFVAYGGLLKVASIAEEVKDPKRNIPLGLFVSLFVVTIAYTLITIVAVGTVAPEFLSNSVTPIADSAENILGVTGKILLTAAALLAFISTGNAGIMAASRYPFALSRDNLLPSFINKVNPRFKTPMIAIIITGFLIALSFLLKLDILVKSASTVVILTYILAQVSIIILRASKIQNYKPSFKAPLYPWIQIISIVIFILLIIEMGLMVILISFGLVLFGLGFYLIYGRRKNEGAYALLHIIENITNRRLASKHLDAELKQILSERDDIKFDRFDKLVESAVILDLEGPFELADFFEKVSVPMAQVIKTEPAKILELLNKREEETSTAINDFIAIPHIIIEGTDFFELMIVRCSKGIKFSDKHPAVKSVFILAGTMDQRNFHLRALSSIAQIVLGKDFQSHWQKARDVNNLKDLIHLSERQRFYS